MIEKELQAGAKVINFENRYRCSDGSYRWLSWVLHPNTVKGVTYAVARDITEWKQNDEELKKSKALLDATGRMARVGGWELDADTLEAFWTEETCRIHEVPLPLDQKTTLQEAINFFHPEDRPKLEQAIQRALDHGEPYDMDLRFITAKGKHLWTRTLCKPEIIDGRTVKLKGTFQNITDRKRVENELKRNEKLQAQISQAQKMESVGRLAGGVAHDFNNMLGVILGRLEFALEEIEKDHNLYADLKEIQTAAKRSADLTKQLLTFARKQTISPRQLDLNDTVEGMLNMLRRLIGEGIDLIWKPAAHIWPVKMDPTQIDQILANLCVNARDAISGVGELTIETGTKTFDRQYCRQHSGFILASNCCSCPAIPQISLPIREYWMPGWHLSRSLFQ